MPTTLAWKVVTEDKVLEGFVGTATNKAFTLTETKANNFLLESHITGHEIAEGITAANTADTITAGKALADALLVQYNIPQNGTVLGYQPA